MSLKIRARRTDAGARGRSPGAGPEGFRGRCRERSRTGEAGPAGDVRHRADGRIPASAISRQASLSEPAERRCASSRSRMRRRRRSTWQRATICGTRACSVSRPASFWTRWPAMPRTSPRPPKMLGGAAGSQQDVDANARDSRRIVREDARHLDRLCSDGALVERGGGARQLRLERHRLVGRGARESTWTATGPSAMRSSSTAATCTCRRRIASWRRSAWPT